MRDVTRRQFLQGAALAAGAGVTGVSLASCTAPAAGPAAGSVAGAGASRLALPAGRWLAEVAATTAGTLIANRIEKSDKRRWTKDGKKWAPRVEQLASQVSFDYMYWEIYAFPARRGARGTRYPGSCGVTLTEVRTGGALTDRVVIATADAAVTINWWMRQALSALLLQTARDGIDETARLREQRLFLLAAMPVGEDERWRSPDGRTAHASYRAADGNRVSFNYSRSADGSEQATVSAPGFPRAGGPPVWDVALTRELSEL